MKPHRGRNKIVSHMQRHWDVSAWIKVWNHNLSLTLMTPPPHMYSDIHKKIFMSYLIFAEKSVTTSLKSLKLHPLLPDKKKKKNVWTCKYISFLKFKCGTQDVSSITVWVCSQCLCAGGFKFQTTCTLARFLKPDDLRENVPFDECMWKQPCVKLCTYISPHSDAQTFRNQKKNLFCDSRSSNSAQCCSCQMFIFSWTRISSNHTYIVVAGYLTRKTHLRCFYWSVNKSTDEWLTTFRVLRCSSVSQFWMEYELSMTLFNILSFLTCNTCLSPL